jgi:hypothetical protein
VSEEKKAKEVCVCTDFVRRNEILKNGFDERLWDDVALFDAGRQNIEDVGACSVGVVLTVGKRESV